MVINCCQFHSRQRAEGHYRLASCTTTGSYAKDFPLDELLSAADLDKIQESLTLILHINRKYRPPFMALQEPFFETPMINLFAF